jgi:pimeloyl-ACP methyl ester carboxylesterase
MPSIGFIIAGAYLAVFALALGWTATASLLASLAAKRRDRQPTEDAPVDEPSTVITLVHGTWSRRAAWTQPGSPLRRTLSRAAAGPVVFHRFGWSGRNSISARQRGVRELVRHLHAVTQQWPQARHYLVAHSHGGNIAFHALGDPMLHDRIHGLVCLSTPFLTVTPRDLGPVGPLALWWLPVILIFYGSAIVLQQVMPADSDTWGPLLLIGAVAAGFLVSHRLTRLATTGLSALDFPEVDPTKVLIVRAAADEASAALGATHIVSWLSGRVWLLTSRMLGATVDTVEGWRAAVTRRRRTTAAIVTALLLVIVLAWQTRQPALGVAAGMVLLVAVALLVRGGLVAAFLGRFLFAVLAAPFLLVVAVLGLSVGPELLAAGLLFQVTAESTPPGRWVVWQVGAGDGARGVSTGLMHSASYQSAAALEIVERWFALTESTL